jgi:Rrf2 family transcriptional regulator, cysteine metabolism repressor
MLFSTRAEYGVRLMVELGRQENGTPVALSAVAESERLPLSYLEHLVAKLRKAGLVESQRGAHGGYRLGRPAGKIQMLEVVEALEGPIAPMECFEDHADGKVSCSHETDGDHACATKLLWTRVQGGVNRALSGTTLAEMVEFADQHAPANGRKRAAVGAA